MAVSRARPGRLGSPSGLRVSWHSGQEGLAQAWAAEPVGGWPGPWGLPLQSHSFLQPPRAVYARAFYNKMPGAGLPPTATAPAFQQGRARGAPGGGQGRAWTAVCTTARSRVLQQKAPGTCITLRTQQLGDVRPWHQAEPDHADGPQPRHGPGSTWPLCPHRPCGTSRGQLSPRAADTTWPRAGSVPQELKTMGHRCLGCRICHRATLAFHCQGGGRWGGLAGPAQPHSSCVCHPCPGWSLVTGSCYPWLPSEVDFRMFLDGEQSSGLSRHQEKAHTRWQS